MVLIASAKREAFSSISQAKAFDSTWPPIIIAEWSNAIVIADHAAAN